MSLATTAFNKLSQLWCSSLGIRAKVHIFKANIVPVLLHGLSSLTMEVKNFRKVDAWFFRHLGRAIGVKHSYNSHIPNKAVWLGAHKPTLPSQQILASQFRLLLQSLNADPADPTMFRSDQLKKTWFPSISTTRQVPHLRTGNP